MTVSLTESSAKYFIKMMGGLENIKKKVIKFGIKKSGCSGYSYDLNLIAAEEVTADCIIIESHDCLVAVNKEDLPAVTDTIIDCVQNTQFLGEMIVFRNPQAKNECGCGESFNF